MAVPRIALGRRCSVGDECVDENARCTSAGLCQCTARFHNIAGVCGMIRLNVDCFQAARFSVELL